MTWSQSFWSNLLSVRSTTRHERDDLYSVASLQPVVGPYIHVVYDHGLGVAGQLEDLHKLPQCHAGDQAYVFCRISPARGSVSTVTVGLLSLPKNNSLRIAS